MKKHLLVLLVLLVLAVIPFSSLLADDIYLKTGQRDGIFGAVLYLNNEAEPFAEFVSHDGVIEYQGKVPVEDFQVVLKQLSVILRPQLSLIEPHTLVQKPVICNVTGELDEADGSWGPDYPHSGTFTVADDDWWTGDKLAHAVGFYWLSVECQGLFNNRYIGALAGLAGGVLWEIKDAYISWADFGPVGGDGLSYKDTVADLFGCLYSLHLFDFVADRIKKVDRKIIEAIFRQELGDIEELTGKERPPMHLFWARLTRVGIYTAGWIGVCGAYHSIVDGEAYPNSASWARDEGLNSGKFLATHNSETSFVLPFAVNAFSRPWLDLWQRVFLSGVALYGYEALNARFSGRDVPLLGDQEYGGWRQSDVNLGLLVGTMVVPIWEVFFHPDEALAEAEVGMRLTPEGLGIGQTAKNRSWAWSLTPKLTGETSGFSFRVSF